MNPKLLFSLLALFTTSAGLTVAACSASSSAPPPGKDSGGAADTSHAPDTGTDASPDTSAYDAADAAEVSFVDAARTCTGLDAAEMMLTFPHRCGECAKALCCAEAERCAADPTCVSIILCQKQCIESGEAGPISCAEDCIKMAHDPEAGSLAQPFDVCLSTNCSTFCTGGK